MLVKLRKYFISGLIVFLPIALTVYVFYLGISFAEGTLGKFFRPLFAEKFGFYFWGLSIIVGVAIIVSIGFFVTNFLGRKIYNYFEGLFSRLPLFRKIYPAIKEMATFFFSGNQIRSFKQVVLIEYPRKGIYSYGFLTNESSSRVEGIVKQDLCNVFIPSAPGPLTGFAVMVPRKDVIFTDIRVEEAVKFILSGGVVNPAIL